MAATAYTAYTLTGGGANALDYIDGAGLLDGDFAFVWVSSATVYFYILDDDSAAAESSPAVISPDNNAGDKRWILASINANAGTYAGAVSAGSITQLYGALVRPKFTRKDADEIYIRPGLYDFNGATRRLVYWASELTFQFGSGGSNADSDNLGNNEWHCIYIDSSAVEAAGSSVLTPACFRNSTTGPSWSDAKRGHYNGDDMCIGAVLTNGSGEILEFYCDADRFVLGEAILDAAGVDYDTDWTDVTLTAPPFVLTVDVVFKTDYVDGASLATWRPNGGSGGGAPASYASAGATVGTAVVPVRTDGNQKIEVKHDTSNGNQTSIYTRGYRFPSGM